MPPTFATAPAVDSGEVASGTFAANAGGGVPTIDAAHDLFIASKSSTARTLTITHADGSTFLLWIVNGSREIVTGASGAISVSLGATDAGVSWAYAPAGAFFRCASPVGSTGSSFTSPLQIPDSGTFIINDDTPTALFTATDGGAGLSSIALTGTFSIGGAQTIFSATSGIVTTYNGLATAGQVGIPVVYASVSQKAETAAADANVLTLTPPAVAGTYRITVAVSVASATSGIVGFTVNFKDANSTAPGDTAFIIGQLGSAGQGLTKTIVTGTAQLSGMFIIDVDASATAIVIKWVGGGTIVAKVSATIEQVT